MSISGNGPVVLVSRYILYPVAPDTEFQLTVMLLEDISVADTPMGVSGLPAHVLEFPSGRVYVPMPPPILAKYLVLKSPGKGLRDEKLLVVSVHLNITLVRLLQLSNV